MANEPILGRLSDIQMLRGVAALLVVVVHAINVNDWRVAAGLDQPSIVGSFLSFNEYGASGVDLFFVISGFVMAMMLANNANRAIGDFAFDRLIRIAPPFWAASLAYGLLLMIAGRAILPSSIVASVTIIPLDPTHYTAPLLYIGWSLGFELIFYAIVGLTLIASPAHRTVMVASALLISITLASIAPPPAGLQSLLINAIFAEFLLGIACFAIWRRFAGQLTTMTARALTLTGIGLLILPAIFGVDFDAQYMAIIDGGASLARALTWGVPWAMVLTGLLLDSVRANHAFQPRLIHRIGDASYALYLVHPMIALASEVWVPKAVFDPDILILAVITVSVVCGMAAHRWIEAPMLRALRRKTSTVKQSQSLRA